MRSKKAMEQMSLRAERFLRSINIRYDADFPERIAHFYPTAKTIPFLRALLGNQSDRAFFVVAPYGSGKSITAMYLLHLIENRPKSAAVLELIKKRLENISSEIARFDTRRRNQKKHGIVLTLHGYAESIAKNIKSSALEAMRRVELGRESRSIEAMSCNNIEEAIRLLTEVRRKALNADIDRILIIWDEFGRHLESLLLEGRSSALLEIQTLAEFVSRSKDIPIVLALLLHRDIYYYVGNTAQSVRTELKKIEGRFQTIQYIDDSKEIYRLISEIVSSRKDRCLPLRQAISLSVIDCKKVGLFSDFTKSELEDALDRIYPLEPITFYLLPRLSARVSQNERTLFSFLYNVDLQDFVGPDLLYDYFSQAMQSDTAVGGTYRQWLEAQSALSKTENHDEVKALKTACLLGLGTSGERSRATRELLIFALKGYRNNNDVEGVVDRLITRKLLLHRKHNDEVSVWHGTDVDLRGKLEEEKARNQNEFNLLDFLIEESPPPSWRPLEYNDDFSIKRFFLSEYHNMNTLTIYLNKLHLGGLPVGCDGKVLYLIAETYNDLKSAEGTIRKDLKHDRIMVAIPQEPLSFFDAALEVWCLLRMQFDSDLIGSDPLVISELHQMTDDARSHLQSLIERLVSPGPEGPRWFYKGSELSIRSSRDLRNQLSYIMRSVFSLTPKINNEMIVREKPSGVVINARKKLLLGILERSGQENLGINGNFPDASMFRAVLLNTGIYRQNGNREWRYASPGDIEDPGLREVWERFRILFTEPSTQPKDLRQFFDELKEPPFGVRAGLLPILFAAGMKAFQGAFSLTRNGAYITDILPSEVENLCREPHLYRLVVLELNKERIDYLTSLYRCFHGTLSDDHKKNNLIQACFDAIEEWKGQLPAGAMTTRQLSEETLRFRTVIAQGSDPVRLLFEEIPAACDCSVRNHQQLVTIISKRMEELQNVIQNYRCLATESFCQALSFGQRDNGMTVLEIAKRWISCFPEDAVQKLTSEVSKGLLSRLGMPYDREDFLLDSISSLLVGKSINRWDDSTAAAFDREIKNTVHQIEETVFLSHGATIDRRIATNGLTQLARGRMTELFNRLAHLVGEKEAKEVVLSVVAGRAKDN